MTSSPDDNALGDYLERDSAVSQHYRNLHGDEVPASLDSAVLSQARAAVAKPKLKHKPAWLRWGPPLALAASAVMVVAIVLEVGVQDRVRLPSAVREQAASAQRSESSERIQRDQTQLQAPASPFPAAPTQAEVPVAQRASEPKAEANANDASDVSQFAVVSQPAAQLDTDTHERRVVSPPAAVAQKSAAPLPPPVETLAGTTSVSPPVVTDTPEAEVTTASARRPEDSERLEQIVITGSEVRPERNRRRFGPRDTVAPARASSDESPDARAEQWLREIRRLRMDGKEAAADEEWRRFREVFPNFTVERSDVALPASEREPAR